MSQPELIPLQADIVTRFMTITEGEDTPHLFKKWGAIALVAGALERRVWVNVGFRGGEVRQSFPNLFTFLVGPPGTGKYIVNIIRELWRNVIEPGTNKASLNVADNNLTKAAMVDCLAEATRSFLPPKGPPYEYNSLLIAAEEFGVFLPQHDLNFLAVLNDIYNAPDSYSEKRRHGPARNVEVKYPLLNILAGVQPVWMKSIFPAEAWGMGLFSRTIMIYATSGDPTDPFSEGNHQPHERRLLRQSLNKISNIFGEMKWEGEAKIRLRDWHLKGGPPTPTHSKLEHYNRRRTQHVIKLALVSAVSRTLAVGSIDRIDVDRAIEWLVEAEVLMPDIFRAMVGQSDMEVIEELYNHMVNLFAISKHSPIAERHLVMFLIQRVPSEKVPKIIESAERSNMIARVAGTDSYIPRNKKEFVE